MATFKSLFSKFIDELQRAKVKTYLHIDRDKIRDIAQEQAINILKLHKEEKDLWNAYYNEEIKNASPEREEELKDFDAIAKGTKSVKFSKLLKPEHEWFRDALNRPKDQYDIGHKDISIALTRAKIILDHVRRGTEGGEMNPTQIRIIEKIIKALAKVDKLDEAAINKLKKETKLTPAGRLGKEAIFAMLESTEKVAVNQKFLNQAKDDFAALTYTIEFEASNINAAKGTLSSILGRVLKEVLNTTSETGSMKKLNSIDTVQALMQSKASPSMLDNIRGFLKAGFTGKKYRPTKKSGSKKHERVYKPRSIVTSLRRAYQALTIKKLPERKEKAAYSLFSIRELINEVLAERVKQLMGKSTDPAVKLRYQSGRFAESAELLTLTRTQAGILAGTYTYQKSPYEVFAPGHRLANGSRDPAIYIEGAVRGAAMSILKTKFPGISLEVV